MQAVGRTTSQLGGGLAYASMLNLVAGFGPQAFVASAEAARIAAVAGDASLLVARSLFLVTLPSRFSAGRSHLKDHPT